MRSFSNSYRTHTQSTTSPHRPPSTLPPRRAGKGAHRHHVKKQPAAGPEGFGATWVSRCAAALFIRMLGPLVAAQWRTVANVAGGVGTFMTYFPCHALTVTVDYFCPRHRDKLDEG